LVLSCLLSSVLLARWLSRAAQGPSSVASLVGCVLAAGVAMPAALFVGLVMGGSLGIGWGERLIDGRTGALVGLYIGFCVIATSCIVSAGLIGGFLGDRVHRFRVRTSREA